MDAVDIYAFSLSQTRTISVNLAALDTPVRITLESSDGTDIDTAVSTLTTDGVFSQTLASGAYQLRITATGGTRIKNKAYTLDVTLGSGQGPVDPDSNGTFATATNLGTFSTAQSLSINPTSNPGVASVGTSDPVDGFQFTTTVAGTGTVSLSGLTANADLRVFDANQNLVASSLNGGTASETLSDLLPAGRYFVAIRGVGADTNYTLSFTFDGGGSNGQPDLKGSSFDAATEPLAPGDTFDIHYTIQNVGALQSGSSTVSFYASNNSTISSSDTFLGADSVPNIFGGLNYSDIVSVTLPASFTDSDNVFYVGMIVDSEGTVDESNESNNLNLGLGIDSDQVDLTPAQEGFVETGDSFGSVAGINPMDIGDISSGFRGTFSGSVFPNSDESDLIGFSLTVSARITVTIAPPPSGTTNEFALLGLDPVAVLVDPRTSSFGFNVGPGSYGVAIQDPLILLGGDYVFELVVTPIA